MLNIYIVFEKKVSNVEKVLSHVNC